MQNPIISRIAHQRQYLVLGTIVTQRTAGVCQTIKAHLHLEIDFRPDLDKYSLSDARETIDRMI